MALVPLGWDQSFPYVTAEEVIPVNKLISAHQDNVQGSGVDSRLAAVACGGRRGTGGSDRAPCMCCNLL